MADPKITALAAITTVDPAADVLPIVDVSDTSMAPSGPTKKITSNQILGAGGTATLASATVTGAATVGTTLGVTGVSTFAAGTALLPALTTTGDTNTGIYYPAADTFAVTTGGTERYRVDSSGNLLVGTTTTSGNAGGLKLSNVAGNLGQITFSNNSGSSDYVARFNWGSTPTLVGNITVSSTATAYNTSSDYRLKESVKPLNGGLARVNALKPSVYSWKSDGSTGEGFLAHELAEVVPAAVTGEKDAVNADGSIKSQGIDMSRVVPILVAAIQELTAEVNALKNA